MEVIDTWCRSHAYDPAMLTDTRAWFFKQILYGTLEGVLSMVIFISMITWLMVGVFYWHNSRRNPCR